MEHLRKFVYVLWNKSQQIKILKISIIQTTALDLNAIKSEIK